MLEHAEGLLAAGKDPGVWTWLAVRQPADLPRPRSGLVGHRAI